jgi:hypothetical protein
MNSRLKYYKTLLPALLLVFVISCKEDEPTAEAIFLGKIGHHWTSTSILLDASPVNGAFADFELTLGKNKTYNTVNGNAPIWPASGKFTVKAVSSTVGFNLLRDDGTEIEVEELTENKLVLKFHYDAAGGRRKGVTGNYIFELEK